MPKCDSCGETFNNETAKAYHVCMVIANIPVDDSKASIDLGTPKQVLIAYMKSKIEQGDWHAVSDAANDLRVLEARK